MNDAKEKEYNEYLKSIVKGSEEKILGSSIFVGLLTPAADKRPEVLLQFGIAVLHDKPIGVLVFEGVPVSESLKKIAFAVEYVKDRDDFEEATKRLIEKADLKGIK